MIIDNPKDTDIRALRALWHEAFGDGDEFLDAFFSTAFSKDRARLARADGEIAGMLYWFDCELDGKKCAYIYAVATAYSHRKTGVCRMLMNDSHEHLKRLGYKHAILVPGSQELFAFYENLGYRHFSSIGKIELTASEEAIPLKKISKNEYAVLRREYLPKGGVIQEGEGLDFLETYASFYKGKDFLLAGYLREDTLIGVELLGNTSPVRLSSITHSLFAKSGKFRTLGSDAPFAMYYPLCEDILPKTRYFGLAFD